MKDKAILARLATRIINTPLMIHPDKLNVILNIIGPRIGLDNGFPIKVDSEAFDPIERIDPYNIENLAIVPIYGSLVHRAGWLDAMSGIMSYEEIRSNFRRATDDPAVESVLLDVDTFGGEAAGVFDLADEIYQARAKKEIIAISNEHAYSGGYALASAASKVYVTRTAGVGSIGVIAVHVDQSEHDKKEGMKYTAIYAGSHKNDFTPHAPLPDDVRSLVQEMVNETNDLFADLVARNRGLTTKAIKEMEAITYRGKKAVEAGLADGVMSFDGVLNTIILNHGGRTMNQQELETSLASLMAEKDVNLIEALAKYDFVPKASIPEGQGLSQEEVDKLVKDASAKGETDTLTRINGIMDLCKVAEMPELAGTLIKENLSVEAAQKKILEVKAEQSSTKQIVSTISGLSAGNANALLADAESRAKAQNASV